MQGYSCGDSRPRLSAGQTPQQSSSTTLCSSVSPVVNAFPRRLSEIFPEKLKSHAWLT
jgi:hypothetical protein